MTTHGQHPPVVLLANAYPFGTWEPYLEPELDRLAKRFDVSLYALSVRKKQSKIRRSVPATVRVVSIPLRSFFLYLFIGVAGLISREYRAELKRALGTVGYRLSCVAYTAKIWTRAQWEARVIKLDLLENGFDATSTFVLYSYRMEYQAYLCYLLKRYFLNAKVLVRGHASDLEVEHRPGSYVPFRELSFTKVDRLVVISQYNRRYLAGRYPTVGKNIIVSYLGTEDFGTQTWHDSAVLRLVSISHLGANKRVHLLMDAIVELQKAHSGLEIQWIHFGTGNDLEKFRNKAVGLDSHVDCRFVGQIDHTQLVRLLVGSETDLLLSASSREGLPVSMMEAMSMGIPVVSTPVAGVPEIVKDGINGWLLDESQIVASLTDRLWQYCECMSFQKQQLRTNARRTWRSMFSADAAYGEFVQLIEDLVGGTNE